MELLLKILREQCKRHMLLIWPSDVVFRLLTHKSISLQLVAESPQEYTHGILIILELWRSPEELR